MTGGRKASVLILLILTALGATALIHITTSPNPVQTTDISQETTIQITTGADTGASTDAYGLLNEWEKAYSDSGTHDYLFNGSSTDIMEECGNCHMDTGGGFVFKHRPPMHPIAIEGMSGEAYSGEWFYDDDLHRGPNTRLAAQDSGIIPGTQCGACHTPTDPSTAFGPDITDSATQLSNDPHSVHRDVLTREGCIRCHVYNNRTFDQTALTDGNGDPIGGIIFTQGNATRSTYGIANPINMTRVWDGVFLSTPDEANYTYNAGAEGLNVSGSGWNRYGNAETSRATQYGCGDCHDQFHAEQGYADTGGNGIEFAFNDSAGSRKGPYAPVTETNSIGLTLPGNINFTCGKCHPTDAHAVHTNGGLNSRASLSAVQDEADQSIINSGVLGAELCDECHSQNIDGEDSSHFGATQAQERGLNGTATDSHDRYPDLNSDQGSLADVASQDCGFCHQIR